ncbi:MAG: flagellar basal body P-ring formation chaperone FlgA, partial [Geobacteraceae bacterium]|nr:flagellar basal body P-ring formation chaperone FlgA [Geobacteraceae bacterium]
MLGCVFFLCLVSATHGFAFQIQVELSAHTSVDSDEISLGDVAQITPHAPQLESVRLGRSSSAGDSRTLDRSFIARALQRAGVNPDKVSWSGADVVTVTRAGQRISTTDIQASISSYLAGERNLLPDVDINFEPYQEPEAFVAPKGKLHVEVIPAADNLFSSRSMTLIYRVDGRVVNNLTIRGRMSAEGDVVVASSRIRRGSKIQPDDVDLVRCDITDTDEPVFSLAEAVGMELSRSVRGGDPIERRHLQPPVVIERRAYVKIIAERGPMRIEATGTALEDGRLGETIRVRNSS